MSVVTGSRRRPESCERIRLKQHLTPTHTYYYREEKHTSRSSSSDSSRHGGGKQKQLAAANLSSTRSPKSRPVDPLVLKYGSSSNRLRGYCYDQTQSAPDLTREGVKRRATAGGGVGVTAAGRSGSSTGVKEKTPVKRNPEKELKLLNAKIVSQA